MNVLVVNPANKPFTNRSILAEPLDVLQIATIINNKFDNVKVIDMDVNRMDNNISEYLSIKYSTPEFIIKMLIKQYDLETTKKISAASINNWLLNLQLLEAIVQPNGKTKKLPTEQGKELGIFTEERTGQYGTYISVLFSSAAQQFIYDNIDAIINFKNENRSEAK